MIIWFVGFGFDSSCVLICLHSSYPLFKIHTQAREPTTQRCSHAQVNVPGWFRNTKEFTYSSWATTGKGNVALALVVDRLFSKSKAKLLKMN